MRKLWWALISAGAAATCWAAPAAADSATVVAPPASFASDCSSDVSQPMQHWLNSLAANTEVAVPKGSCYLVDEGLRLRASQGLTISGGTWVDGTVPVGGASPNDMNPVFWFVGGSNDTVENVVIRGESSGRFVNSGAFEAGVRSDGVIGFTVSNVSVVDVFGDGVELTPLRALNDLSGTILNPTENASISNVQIQGAGRQGVTLASVTGATLTSISITHVGMNAFDVEADQWNEGAQSVFINGCTVGGQIGGLFFANGGASAGAAWTGNITVEGCTMTSPEAGDAILVQDPSAKAARGPMTFVNDTLLCGSSVYVACVQSLHGNITINSSVLQMPPASFHEAVFHASTNSSVSFGQDTVMGYGSLGTVDGTSTVTRVGGTWTPFG